MIRRRDLLAALGATAGLAGCITPHPDPVPTMTVHLRKPSRTAVTAGWETSVDTQTVVTPGVGEYPTVQAPRVTVYDADRTPLDSVRLPVFETHDRRNRITPPTGTASVSPTPTATPSETDTTEATAGEPERPPDGYRQPAVPADSTVEITTTTAPAWVGIEFAEASRPVSVDLAKYTGDGSVGADWTVSTHEYDGSPFRSPTE